MQLAVKDVEGKVVETVQVRDDVFGVPMNEAVVHQVMVGQLANARQGTVAVKNRARVAGGGIKPRPQKGSGRSRQGSIRAPQWKGGGVVFGPVQRSFRHRTTKRLKRHALVAMLSDKVRANQLTIVDSLPLEQAKTKEFLTALKALNAEPAVLLVADGSDPSVLRAARNIPRLTLLPAALLNTLDLLKHRTVVITVDGVRKAEQLWGGPFVRRRPDASGAGE